MSNLIKTLTSSRNYQIVQQLPEYGVMFHRVGREKRPVIGELILGVCAKGIIVYENKNHIRTVTRRFLWRETDSISTGVNEPVIFDKDFVAPKRFCCVIILIATRWIHLNFCISKDNSIGSFFS